MIPRCVKTWLLIYGLFFGLTIGGTLTLIGSVYELGFYLWFAFIGATFFIMFLIDWRYKDILEKWLPHLNASIFDFFRNRKETKKT